MTKESIKQFKAEKGLWAVVCGDGDFFYVPPTCVIVEQGKCNEDLHGLKIGFFMKTAAKAHEDTEWLLE
eukprot:7815189-Lingulodinium_polyedra.AAC.1